MKHTEHFYGKRFTLGVLGGGQLGRMLIQEAIDLDVDVHILDPSPDAPCRGLCSSFTVGDFRDKETVLAFGKGKDLITIEIEDVNVEALEILQSEGVRVCPDPRILKVIQDKGAQKQFYVDHRIPTSPFRLITDGSELSASDLPIVQKLRVGGYDGRGVQVLRTEESLSSAFNEPSVLEDLVDIQKELAVIVARNANGETKTFPVVELVFDPEANLVTYLFSPAQIDEKTAREADELACSVANALELEGILAVEMFLDTSGHLMVNECAPRTHNSGHHTIEGNYTSQFAQHLRAILNLPLGNTDCIQPAAMVNLLGEKGFEGPVVYEGLIDVLAMDGVYPHLYGKTSTKPFRKMGHITVVDKDLDAVRTKAQQVSERVRVIA
jgi:5-(carboxyamino)imidazole ribonucleotide synthase